MSALDRKLGRDLWRQKGQVSTIALVLACGIMAMIMLRSTWSSLIDARDAYYAQYRFGDVFARLERAPAGAAARLAALPDVAVAYPRISEDVMVPLAGEPDPITGRVVSIPDDGEPPLGALYLRAGRLPTPGVDDEVGPYVYGNSSFTTKEQEDTANLYTAPEARSRRAWSRWPRPRPRSRCTPACSPRRGPATPLAAPASASAPAAAGARRRSPGSRAGSTSSTPPAASAAPTR